MSKTDAFAELGTELDRESYEWLCDNYPSIAAAVEAAVMHKATPEAIKRYVMERLGPERGGLATRCQNAARHLGRAK